MKLIVEISEEDYNFVKRQVADGITNPLKMCIANGIPLEEELHREKEQAYYLGYEDGRKSEWTAVAEIEPQESEE